MKETSTSITPHKINKPIQILGAWLAGLILIDTSFLTAAQFLDEPSWLSSLLVIASILNVPLFLFGLYQLQTKFRKELQDDEYYSKHLERESEKDYEQRLNILEKEKKNALLTVEGGEKFSSKIDGFSSAVKKVKRENEYTASDWSFLGIEEYRKNNFRLAQSYFEKALELDPEEIMSLNNLGTLLNCNGRYQEALDMLDKAISIDPKYPLPYHNKGNVFINTEEYDEAEKFFRLAHKLMPKHPAPLNSIGCALFKKKEDEEALIYFDLALLLDPKYPDPYIGRGSLKYHNSDYWGAVSDATKAIVLGKKDSMPFKNRALAYKKLELFSKAASDYETLSRIEPDKIDWIKQSADNFYRANDYEKAKAAYSKIGINHDEYASAQLNLIEISLLHNEVEEAKHKLELLSNVVKGEDNIVVLKIFEYICSSMSDSLGDKEKEEYLNFFESKSEFGWSLKEIKELSNKDFVTSSQKKEIEELVTKIQNKPNSNKAVEVTARSSASRSTSL
ncbi:tetratricopeptide (TPR) repeat protein [Puniceicoccus vermicola]|nr:tetratricopeptide repeat protein [Puniceicoccus vermicola]